MRKETELRILKLPYNFLLLELPTGFGKSKIAIEYLKIRDYYSKILIVVPRLVLIQNWKDEFKKWGGEDLLSKLQFTTYASLHKYAGDWDAIIFDEAHHLSERCCELLPSFQFKCALLLSASIKKEVRERLNRTFPNLRTYKVPVKQAIQEHVLPEPTVYLIELSLDNSRQDCIIIRNKNKGRNINIYYKDRWKYMNVKNQKISIYCTQQEYYNEITGLINWYKQRVYNPVYKNLYLRTCGDRLKWLSYQKNAIIHSLLEDLKDERTLTFCSSIEQTKLLCKHCINSKNKNAIEYLNAFNGGKLSHISACNMLDEGVNLVNCRVGVYASLNSSERMIVQKLGRLLRHPKPIIIIPYFKNTRDEEIVDKMCEDYNKNLIFKVKKELIKSLVNYEEKQFSC